VVIGIEFQLTRFSLDRIVFITMYEFLELIKGRIKRTHKNTEKLKIVIF